MPAKGLEAPEAARVRLTLAISTILLLWGGGAPAASADDHANWLVVRTTLPADATSFSVFVNLTGRADGPLVLGLADSMGLRDVWTTPGTGTFLAAGIPGLEIVALRSGDFFSITLHLESWALGHEPDYALLVFAADATLTSWGASVRADGDALSVHGQWGSGARSVQLTDADGEGAGVAATTTLAGAAAGVQEVRRTVPAGIVGAVETNCAIATCHASWTTPEGESGTVTTNVTGAVSISQGPAGFAGPAGEWRWAYDGVGKRATLAAYAPVGDLWPLLATG